MKRKSVSYKEIAYSNMMSIEALINLLTRKGLITQQEVLDELMQLGQGMKGEKVRKF